MMGVICFLLGVAVGYCIWNAGRDDSDTTYPR